MNFVGQGAETPLLGNGFSTRVGPPGSQGAINLANQPGAGAATGYVSPDGVSSRGFAQFAQPCSSGNDAAFNLPAMSGASPGSSSQGGFLGLINNLINQITSILNGYSNEAGAEGPGTQNVSDGTFASAGDPHLSEDASVTGASGNTSAVNHHFDSMSSHDDLLSSQDFNGGYRLSTAVTAPNANGITLNQSATVHANNNLDNITLRNDGSFSITSDGNNVSLATGQSATLEGGETVTSNADGSLTVLDQNLYGGSIATTMSAKGGGVDVSAAVHHATVGGDIASGTVTQAPQSTPPPLGNTGNVNMTFIDPTIDQPVINGFA